MNGGNADYNEETANKAKETAERYIEAKYEGVNSIELGEPYTAPMGSMTIDGKVNDAGFSISFNKDISVAGISVEKGFPEHKKQCLEEGCDY